MEDIALRIPVTDLVGSPGATRALQRAVTREELTDHDTWGPADEALIEPLELDLHLDSVVEGILVRGTIEFDLELSCARCTEPVRIRQSEQVSELFLDPTKLEQGEEVDDGYELLDGDSAIDISTMLRDVVVLDLPVRATHDHDCTPVMADGVAILTQEEHAAHLAAAPDTRWAALADLEVPPAN